MTQDRYMDAVAWAYENGIVNGTSLTTFSPDEDVTREQMAAILFRYSNYMNYDTSNEGNLGTFTDADAVSDYVLIPMKWAHGERLITGIDSSIVPFGNATRAQAATILMRFCFSVIPEE